MSPATAGPLTVLLVPPEGDTALLADECGGRVPTLDIHVPADGSPGWTLPTPYTVTPVRDLPPTEARGLLLVHEGAPVAMGCDRAYRVARPTYDERRRVFLARVEDRAKGIYANIPGADVHPWVEGGNSAAQSDARYKAFCDLVAAGVEPVEGLPFVLSLAYTLDNAVNIARWAADMLGARVVLLRDGWEVPSV